MISYDKTDGSIVIDFPDGPVRVMPPTFGGLKRIKAERVRLVRAAQDAAARWETDNQAPDVEDATVTARHAEDRLLKVEELNIGVTEGWWRLILLGDEGFHMKIEGTVPPDPNDWPAGLLYDIRPIPQPNASLAELLDAQSTPDKVVRHWGEAHSRPGPTTSAGQTTPS